MKTGLLFDLDGTLLDTLDDLMDSTNYILAQNGYPQRSRQEIRAFVGNGARNLLLKAAPAGADVDDLLARFQPYYAAHCQIKTKPYPGVEAVIAALREKYPVAIVSNKPDIAVKALCAQLFPGISAVGERPDCPRKPAPDMVKRAMAELEVDRCVYIGDSEVDVLTAKNAQVPCLSVTWGFRDVKTLEEAGAKYFCHRAEEISESIEKILEREH